jgi:NTP pyrophosphatase (non-canonical NTP hydrolase)
MPIACSAKMFSIVFNLRKNGALRKRVLAGETSARQLCAMGAAELAGEVVEAIKAANRAQGKASATLASDVGYYLLCCLHFAGIYCAQLAGF